VVAAPAGFFLAMPAPRLVYPCSLHCIGWAPFTAVGVGCVKRTRADAPRMTKALVFPVRPREYA
jgi:hypothetical protein